jgi:hypothetical protein
MTMISNYLENKWVDHVLRNTAYTSPGTSVYVSLHTADTAEDASGTEVSGSNYSRVQVTSWDAPASRATQNTSTITFPTPSGSWGTCTHYGIWDAATTGNLLFYGALTSSIAPTASSSVTFAAGALDLALTGGMSNYLAHALLSHTLRNTAYTTPGTSLYAALYTSAPTASAAGTEVSGTSYARVQVTTWDAASNGVTANTSTITFPTAGGSWGTIVAGSIMDASTSGNLLFFDDFTGVAVNLGGVYSIAAGGFDVVLA